MNKQKMNHNLIEHILNLLSIPENHDIDTEDLLEKGRHTEFPDLLDSQNARTAYEVINFMDEMPGGFLIYHAEGKEEIIEVLLLKRIDYNHYECITKPAKKLKLDTKIIFNDKLSAVVKEIGDQGIRILELQFEGVLENILNEIGSMPLPPYIKEKLQDQLRYQTVYCKQSGSSAAPTAGLHFTEDLLLKIRQKGVHIAEVLLHVGLGTFRPVKEDDILKHNMHSEYCEIDETNANIINSAIKDGRRVICVGTTSVRTVESLADENGFVKADKMDTNIFIYPGYKFKVVKGLITNFHLPESTLIMLVSAFMGRENALNMYNTAVKEKYRFFSFGDATYII